MLSLASTSLLLEPVLFSMVTLWSCVNALTGLCLIVTEEIVDNLFNKYTSCVNALSGCYLISTLDNDLGQRVHSSVSMPSRAVTSFLQKRW